MPSIPQRLTLFKELVKSCYDLSFWDYTADLTLLTELTVENELLSYFLQYSSVYADLKAYIGSGGRRPLILNDSVGLLWSAVFEYDGNSLKFIHVMGPCNMNQSSKKAILERMDRGSQPVEIRRRLRQALERVPVLPSNTFFMYTIMFHRCVTGETVGVSDFEYPTSVNERMQKAKEHHLIREDSESTAPQNHEGVSDLDQKFMKVIETGDTNYGNVFAASSKASTGVKMSRFGSIRAAKDSIILFIGLCSRAAIRGGLPPAISYNLCDLYVNLVEGCDTMAELSNINHTMFDDYVKRVHAYRTDSSCSREVQACCDYIAIHVTEGISLKDLSNLTGYTDYYLSRKFKREMGMTPSEYLARQKTAHARLLLTSTEKSVQEISDLLHFCSPSYFSATFTKYEGMSPTAYREQQRST